MAKASSKNSSKQPSKKALCKEIIANCLKMNASGINQGTSGNLSIRYKDGLLITPSGVPYDQLKPSDIVFLKMDGSYKHDLPPSSEWRFHRDIMRNKPEVNAIVHAHPTYCTAIAIQGMDIPAIHYMIAAAGGDSIRCAPYHTFGTEELSNAALQALEGRSACLLANHGMIATGPNMMKAMWLTVEVETLARQYFNVLALGDPKVLSSEEIARVVEKFKGYGLRSKKDAA